MGTRLGVNCTSSMTITHDHPRSCLVFQSTPPVWAETSFLTQFAQSRTDFNPLRPCGRRRAKHGTYIPSEEFQSTPPVWAETVTSSATSKPATSISIHSARVGGDSRTYRWPCSSSYFNPLRPCGRRPWLVTRPSAGEDISIHSARVGGDPPECCYTGCSGISIHSARVGGDY